MGAIHTRYTCWTVCHARKGTNADDLGMPVLSDFLLDRHNTFRSKLTNYQRYFDCILVCLHTYRNSADDEVSIC